MCIENFYVGGYEYMIRFTGGTHEIIDVNKYENNNPNYLEFRGSYTECLRYKEWILRDYEESKF